MYLLSHSLAATESRNPHRLFPADGVNPCDSPRPLKGPNHVTRLDFLNGAKCPIRHFDQRSPADAELERCPLVLVDIAVPLEVAERDRRPGGERPAAVPLVPGGLPGPPRPRPGDQGVGLVEVREVLAKEDGRVAGYVNVLGRGHQEGVRLAAPGRPSVHDFQNVTQQQELTLTRVRGVRDPRVPLHRRGVLGRHSRERERRLPRGRRG